MQTINTIDELESLYSAALPSSVENGILRLMKALRHEAPDVSQTASRLGVDADGDEKVVQVLKTVHTTHGGKLSVARVLAGTIEDGAVLYGREAQDERVSGIFSLMGQEPTKMAKAETGATVALGAVTVWSGIDANRGVEAYEAAARTANSPGINNGSSPTPAEQAQALLEEGRRKERRTNILIGVSAGMAVTTAVLGVFTDWKGESEDARAKGIEPAIAVTNEGGALSIRGRF